MTLIDSQRGISLWLGEDYYVFLSNWRNEPKPPTEKHLNRSKRCETTNAAYTFKLRSGAEKFYALQVNRMNNG